MMITTEVQDTTRGEPAARLPVELDVFITGQGWKEVGTGLTNSEGRVNEFGEAAAPGVYRLSFDIASYWPEAFFPTIAITFEVRVTDQLHHIALVLSAYGYSTHRAPGVPQ